MKPILFNTEMVKAIMNGKKIVTRRVAKKIPIETHRVEPLENETFECHWGGYMPDVQGFVDGSCNVKALHQVGDILYVRETWEEWTGGYAYKVPDPQAAYNYPASFIGKWKPSLHMPKEAARLYLKVTGVRLERLQDITCVDAEMEGVSSTVYWTPNEMDNRPFEEKWWDDYHFWTHYPQVVFSRLWDSTVNKSDINKYGWEANPWVWVISFEQISKEEAYGTYSNRN